MKTKVAWFVVLLALDLTDFICLNALTRTRGTVLMMAELHCENCGAPIEPLTDPDPSLQSDDPPDYDLLCQKCRSILQEHAEE